MFNISTSTETEIKGTIQLFKRLTCLGNVKDIDGKFWDIHAIIGNYVQACPVNELHPYYTDTSNTTSYSKSNNITKMGTISH